MTRKMPLGSVAVLLALAGAAALRFRMAGGLGIVLVFVLGAGVAWLARKLRITQAKLAAAIAGIDEAVAIIDERGRVIFLNSIAERLTGWDGKQAAGRPFRELGRLAGEQTGARMDDPGVPAHDRTSMLLRSRDGAERPIEATVVPVRIGRGSPRGAIVVLRDVTARRELEDQLRHSERMDTLARLAGGLAHDFNNVLTVISGHAELLAARLGSSPDTFARDHVGEILDAAQRAAQLTRQLLLFGRGQPAHSAALDLNQVLSYLQRTIRSRLNGGLDLSLDLDPEAAWVKCDQTQIEQVILSLTANARGAIPDAGRVAISTRHRRLEPPLGAELAGLRPGQHIELTVAGNGCGMHGNLECTGPALSIASAIVKQWDGAMLASSGPGRGASFTIYLPDAAEHHDRPGSAPPNHPSGAERRTILVSEPDSSVRSLMSSLLREAGHTVLEAGDSIEAARIAADEINRIDLIVADTTLPTIGQSEFIERLSLLRPDIGILRISGPAEADTAARKNRQGRAGVLAKPFTATGFLAEVDRLLKQPDCTR